MYVETQQQDLILTSLLLFAFLRFDIIYGRKMINLDAVVTFGRDMFVFVNLDLLFILRQSQQSPRVVFVIADVVERKIVLPADQIIFFHQFGNLARFVLDS